MKKIIISVILAFPQFSQASQWGFLPEHYFRAIDFNSPQTSLGAYVDPFSPGKTSVGTSVAIFTHSPNDGCLLPSVTCENWSPLALDYSANSGEHLFGFGPSANLAPMVRQMLARIIPWAGRYVVASDIQKALQPSESSINVAFGPKWMICPQQNWKGYFRIAAGVAWKW